MKRVKIMPYLYAKIQVQRTGSALEPFVGFFCQARPQKSTNQTIMCACWTKPHTTWTQECCQGVFTLGTLAWREGNGKRLCIGHILHAPRVLTHRAVRRPENCTMGPKGDLGSAIRDFKHATRILDLREIRS